MMGGGQALTQIKPMQRRVRQVPASGSEALVTTALLPAIRRDPDGGNPSCLRRSDGVGAVTAGAAQGPQSAPDG